MIFISNEIDENEEEFTFHDTREEHDRNIPQF